jgi:hypothetical protein
VLSSQAISNLCGIIYLMNLRTSLHRMNANNNELAKSLFALKSRSLAGIRGDISKDPADSRRERATEQRTREQRQEQMHIPGYFPVTPSILQVRKPEQTTYLHYEL